MAINPHLEELIPFGEGKDRLPTSPSRGLLYRWVNLGCRSANGRLVFLESIKVGGSRYTSREAFDRFWRELNGIVE